MFTLLIQNPSLIIVRLINSKVRAVNTNVFTCINSIFINIVISCIDVIRITTVNQGRNKSLIRGLWNEIKSNLVL